MPCASREIPSLKEKKTAIIIHSVINRSYRPLILLVSTLPSRPPKLTNRLYVPSINSSATATHRSAYSAVRQSVKHRFHCNCIACFVLLVQHGHNTTTLAGRGNKTKESGKAGKKGEKARNQSGLRLLRKLVHTYTPPQVEQAARPRRHMQTYVTGTLNTERQQF